MAPPEVKVCWRLVVREPDIFWDRRYLVLTFVLPDTFIAATKSPF